jgi:imidazolonepropionase-like amidohydrolase
VTRRVASLAALLLTLPLPLAAQATLAPQVRAFASVTHPVIVMTHARVIDGTGAVPRENQTLVIDNGVIRAVGDSASVSVPANARVLDLTGKTVLPGFVMMHEHMFYPSGGGGVYNEQAFSFPRLYLAGGGRRRERPGTWRATRTSSLSARSTPASPSGRRSMSRRRTSTGPAFPSIRSTR